MKVGVLWVGRGARAFVGVEPGGIGRCIAECGVRWVSGTPWGGTPTEFRCEGATGWAGRPPMKFKELAGIGKSHCWARGWVWGRWGTGVCVGVSWGECQAILGRIGRMSGFLVGYFRFGKSGSGSGSGSLGCPNFVVRIRCPEHLKPENRSNSLDTGPTAF